MVSARRIMMVFAASMLIMPWSSLAVSEEPVYFADANLKAAVEQTLGKTNPTPTDMLGLTQWNANSKGITNLTGLEFATNLTGLSLSLNNITDISPLAGLANLTELYLNGNNITDITLLAGLTNLTRLSLTANHITDVTPLAGLANLKTLSLGLNPITNIEPLSGLMNLEVLALKGTEVSDIQALSGLTNLRSLVICCSLSNIEPLSSLTNLEVLYIGGSTQMSDIQVLSGLTNLRSLTIIGTHVSNFQPLLSLTNLYSLVLNSNQFSDIQLLSGFTNLRTLYLAGNQITNIQALSGLTNLTRLRLDDNQINDIEPLSGLTSLETLWIRSNQITDIQALSGLTNLVMLDMGSNRITSLQALSGMSNLQNLWLKSNQISDIQPLTNLRSLQFLDLSGDPLHADAYDIYIPQILENNPGIQLLYDMPLIAWNPKPADGEDFVDPNLMLQWSKGSGAIMHDLYFGTDFAAVSAGVAGTYMARSSTTSYYCGFLGLAKNTTYYWRIDEVDGVGTVYRGNVWSFTVANPVVVDDDAPGDPRPNDPGYSDPDESGSWTHPYDSIQEAINAAVNGDTVVVMDGVYTGVGNRDLDLKGKLITVRSLNGPQNCVIDCQHQGRGFYCHSGETSQTVIDGFTISNGQQYKGAGIYCLGCNPTVRDCVINGCSPDALCVEKYQLTIAGTVEIIGNDLTGSGTLRLANDATLKLSDVQVRCNIIGTGLIQVPAGTKLSIINNAVVNMRNPDEPGVQGSIRGNGLLRIKDSAHLSGSNIEVASLSFEGNSVISENIITTHQTTLYGQIVAKDAAAIINNDIYASGDRYMDVEPAAFVGTLEGNRINITVDKAQGNTEAGLFEIRGRDLFCNEPNCAPGTFRVMSVPIFARSTWTIDRLELVEGAELTLTNRFDYQAPYESGGDTEVLYVRELVLGANSILDLAFNRLYYQSIEQHPTSVIINQPLLGFSLDKILFDQPEEFPNRVSQNNYQNPANPNYDRVHVEQVQGLDFDPTGVMQMRNLEDIDPDSPTFRSVIDARAKVKFAKCAEREIVVRFEYLFEYAASGTELIVYLSDVPDLLALDDPNQLEHYIEVGRISPPPYPRPGSVGSGRPGTFERTVSTGSLDLTEGAWVQLELVESEQIRRLMSVHSGYVGIASSEPDGSVVDIDDIELIAHPTGVCMDLSGDYFPSENDFLILIATCGLPADVDEDGTGSTHSMDVGFSRDGYVDRYDIASCDWLLHVPGHGSLCDLPLTEGASAKMGTSSMGLTLEGSLPLADLPTVLEDLLIIGNRNTSSDDRFYVFDSDATYGNCCDPATVHCNIGVVRDSAGETYLINTDEGVSRLDGSNQKIIPPGKISGVPEPRYGTSATVSVGIRGQNSARVGRPVLDVAFDAEGYAYVVPVVVSPVGQESYLAAAKLQLKTGNPPYSIAKLYDSAAEVQDQEYRTNPREIEIDAAGNIYVLNVDRRDESDILWKYATDGTAKCLSLGNPMDPNYVPDPVGMCVSDRTKTVCVASGQYNASDPSSSTIHVFSQETLELKRSVQIEGMQHVTGITEDPTTGSLWVVGFSMSEIPLYPNPMDDPFYQPYIAKVPRGVGTVKAVSLSDTTNDLALPMAILWTGEVDIGPSDIDRDGQADFKDFAHLATSWKSSYGDPAWNRDADLSSVLGEEGTIDFFDLIILTEHWLDERTP